MKLPNDKYAQRTCTPVMRLLKFPGLIRISGTNPTPCDKFLQGSTNPLTCSTVLHIYNDAWTCWPAQWHCILTVIQEPADLLNGTTHLHCCRNLLNSLWYTVECCWQSEQLSLGEPEPPRCKTWKIDLRNDAGQAAHLDRMQIQVTFQHYTSPLDYH